MVAAYFAEGSESFYTKTSLCRSLLRSLHSSRFNTGPVGDDLTIACVGERTVLHFFLRQVRVNQFFAVWRCGCDHDTARINDRGVAAEP